MVFVIKNGQDLYGVDRREMHIENSEIILRYLNLQIKNKIYGFVWCLGIFFLRPLNKSSHFSLLSFFFAYLVWNYLVSFLESLFKTSTQQLPTIPFLQNSKRVRYHKDLWAVCWVCKSDLQGVVCICWNSYQDFFRQVWKIFTTHQSDVGFLWFFICNINKFFSLRKCKKKVSN